MRAAHWSDSDSDVDRDSDSDAATRQLTRHDKCADGFVQMPRKLAGQFIHPRTYICYIYIVYIWCIYIFIYIRDASAHHNSKVLQGYSIMLSVLRFYIWEISCPSLLLPPPHSFSHTLQRLFPPFSVLFCMYKIKLTLINSFVYYNIN